ncbi:MAG TPA: hypothetical protein VFI31_13155, partial [Pirellulales bacterium]|nr:hypothetical protein [Pirellulales bacterium]
DRKSALTRAVVAVVTSATGIVLLILAASIRQRWKVTYHGHSIRFENSILRSSCLIVDGRVLARGKARLRVGTRVPFGAGAGDLIVVRTRAGLLSYRCQISARAEDQDGKIA